MSKSEHLESISTLQKNIDRLDVSDDEDVTEVLDETNNAPNVRDSSSEQELTSDEDKEVEDLSALMVKENKSKLKSDAKIKGPEQLISKNKSAARL